MHLVTLSFDDGFLKSNLRIAELYEKYGLSACFNIVATAHLKSFEPPNPHHLRPVGDFGIWNELQARGHEIMPHGYRHANKQQLPFDQGRELILRCLEVFARELKGFDARQAIFNFPYNASTPELEAWLPTVVRAFRTGGSGFHPLRHRGQVKVTATAHGPGNCEADLDAKLEQLLSKPSGWLVYNGHGLDEEGWGPIRAEYLDRLLARLTSIQSVRVLPTGRALAEA